MLSLTPQPLLNKGLFGPQEQFPQGKQIGPVTVGPQEQFPQGKQIGPVTVGPQEQFPQGKQIGPVTVCWRNVQGRDDLRYLDLVVDGRIMRGNRQWVQV